MKEERVRYIYDSASKGLHTYAVTAEVRVASRGKSTCTMERNPVSELIRNRRVHEPVLIHRLGDAGESASRRRQHSHYWLKTRAGMRSFQTLAMSQN